MFNVSSAFSFPSDPHSLSGHDSPSSALLLESVSARYVPRDDDNDDDESATRDFLFS